MDYERNMAYIKEVDKEYYYLIKWNQKTKRKRSIKNMICFICSLVSKKIEE
jgi:beta-lactamase class D